MPSHVISHVHRVARQQKAKPGLTFLDRYESLDTDDADDGNFVPSDSSESDDSSDDDSADDNHDDTWTPVPGDKNFTNTLTERRGLSPRGSSTYNLPTFALPLRTISGSEIEVGSQAL